jgi:hypothetical protein
MKSSLLLGLGKNTNHSLLLVTDAMHERTRAAKSPEDLLAIFPTGYCAARARTLQYPALYGAPYALLSVVPCALCWHRTAPGGCGWHWAGSGLREFCMPNKGKRSVMLKVRQQFGSMIDYLGSLAYLGVIEHKRCELNAL